MIRLLRNYSGCVRVKDIFGPHLFKKWQ